MKLDLRYIMLIVLVGFVVVVGVFTSGVLDSEETKETKRLKQIERDLNNEERETLRLEALDRIENKTLSCEYITELLERDSRVKSYLELLDSGKIEKGMRGYWNANNCGFEWNWYD